MADTSPTNGSPFVVGRPLRADEPIFGRDEVLRSIASELARFGSVNVVGERRMGKTSLLNHLVGHPERYFVPPPGEPPFLVARLDLQAGIDHAERFHGAALQAWLAQLPAVEAAGSATSAPEIAAQPTATAPSGAPVKVFVSYSHKDRRWKDRLCTMLKPLLRTGTITLWEDTQIRAGDPWRKEIAQALAEAQVAVLLVSPDFLASEFIAQHELPPLLEAAAGRGLRIVWVAVRPSLYQQTAIETFQAANDPARPLSGLSAADCEKELVRICDQIQMPDSASPQPYGILAPTSMLRGEKGGTARGHLVRRLSGRSEVNYGDFQGALRALHAMDGLRPVLVLDEFECLLEERARNGFPCPGFFNGLRALITEGSVSMVIASRRPLADYFADPRRPGSLTSTFPTPFVPYTLGPLPDDAAQALLLQPNEHGLTLDDLKWSMRWARGHPCHLQAAGAAWYQAKNERQTRRWTERRFRELKTQNCLVNSGGGMGCGQAGPRLPDVLSVIFWRGPLRLGRGVQRLGLKVDDIGAWLLGWMLIVAVLLLAQGVIRGADLWHVLRKILGLS